ncbi:MAG: PqiC family protein [Gammaproteobacteria bacterium]
MKNLLLLILAGLLVACSGGSKVPEPTYYLLRADSGLQSGAQTVPVSIGLGRVSIADYLAQDGIVVATGDGQIRPARQHLWAEPLDNSVRLYLRDAVATQLGQSISADMADRQSWQYRIDVRIDEWHGALTGEAQIVAEWTLLDVPAGKTLSKRRFTRSGALAADGYDALVAEQTQLLNALAADIAGNLPR